MEVQELIPVEYKGVRCLTGKQIGELFGTTPARIKDNFRRAKKYFIEGEHYFKVNGEDLRDLKEQVEEEISKRIEEFERDAKKVSPTPLSPLVGVCRDVNLYTVKGAARHCKMLNMPNALEVFMELEKTYFKPAVPPSNEPQLFNHPDFGKIRAILIDGEIWFIGSDVARALGYKDTDQALRDHVPDKFKITRRFDGFKGREAVLINEAGLYKLIMRSKLPKAEEFSDWTCGEVLPSIRKYGYYSVNQEELPANLQAQLNALKAEVALLRNQLPVAATFDLAVVYCLLMSNGSVKIGMTDNLTRRIKEIERETNLKVLNYKSTPFLAREEATALEESLLNKFSAECLGGEFFSIRFVEIATLI